MLYKRKYFDEIIKYIYEEEIIVIHGARQVGKTSTLFMIKEFLEKNKKKTLYLDLEDARFVELINQGPDEFIKYLKANNHYSSDKIVILIDEIQYLKEPSSFLKLIHDHHKKIKLIVSGSSSFEIKSKFKDSLVGRTIEFEIFPLSFSEFLEFKGYNHVKNSESVNLVDNELKKLYEEYVLYGGYPKIVLTDEIDKKERYIQQIIDTYVKKDVRDLADIRDIEKFNNLIRVLASQSGNLLNIDELSNTLNISRITAAKYLFILESTYIIKLVKPYSKNIRSEISKMPKIFFYDTGIMHMLWLKSLPKQIIGNAFETSVFSELVKSYGKENINFWRTKDKKEIDFILDYKNKILPIEAKINFLRFKKTAVTYFMNEYSITDYKIVSIEGEKINESCFYPWEM